MVGVRGIIVIVMVCMVLIVVRQDVRIKNYVENLFKQNFSSALASSLQATVTDISFFPLSVSLSNVKVFEDSNPGWYWQCNHATTTFSWWHLIFSKKLAMHIVLEDIEIYSKKDGNRWAIQNHIDALLTGGSDDQIVSLSSLQCSSALCRLEDEEKKLQLKLQWDSQTKLINNQLHTTLYVSDGSLQRDGIVVSERCSGVLEHRMVGGKPWLRIKANTHMPFLDSSEQLVCMNGTWSGDRGSCSFKTLRDHITIQPCSVIKNSDGGYTVQVAGNLPGALIHKCLDALSLSSSNIRCDAPVAFRIHGTASIQEYNLQATFDSEAVNIAGILCNNVRIMGSCTPENWKGSCSLVCKNAYPLEGSWKLDPVTLLGSCSFTNQREIIFHDQIAWHIPERAAVWDIVRTPNAELRGKYTVQLADRENSSELKALEGDLCADTTGWKAECLCDHYHAKAQGSWNDCATLDVRVTSPDDQTLITIVRDSHSDKYEYGVDLPCIKMVLSKALGLDIGCTGKLKGVYAYRDSCYTSSMRLDGALRLPKTYNVIKEAQADIVYDPQRHHLSLNNCVINAHEGSLKISHASLMYDNNGSCSFAYVPCLVDQWLVNVDKNLFATVSGHLRYSLGNDGQKKIIGRCMIDQGYIKENLLSQAVQGSMASHAHASLEHYIKDCVCDFLLETRRSIRVKTSFLETSARGSLKITNTLQQPQVRGVVNLNGGSLSFPYRPLYLTKGTLYFLPDHPSDPTIELVAKNKIKKYDVTLSATGSLRTPHITLDSSPSLTEEQVVGLLLVGAQGDSLNSAMPALIMHNVASIMFAHDQSPQTLDNLFKNILQPLGKVSLMPSLTDQTGRGGLRGVLDIEVNDHLRAVVQKNFNLTEDTRVEVEYALSDEVTIRGVRDERRDLGAEVEMRWKF